MKLKLTADDIDLIKYSILAFPAGTSTAYIFKNFISKRHGHSLIPDCDKNTFLREINNVVARNIRHSLESYRRNNLGKSSYIPLPVTYNPNDYIKPRPGLDHILRLPEFSFEIWNSQFSTPSNMPPKKPKSKKEMSASSRTTSRSPTRPSTFVPTSAKANTTALASPHRPDFFKPNIVNGNTVLGHKVDYHLSMKFDEQNLAAAGDGFGIYSMLVNNGAEKDGVAFDVVVLVNIRPIPLDNGLPIDRIPFIGEDKKTIFMPISYGTEASFFDVMRAIAVNNQQQRLGTKSAQLETYFSAMRERIAECPVYHTDIAITFQNCPPFAHSGEFQTPQVIALNNRGLSAGFSSRGYTFSDTILELELAFNQTGFVYVIPLESPNLKVSSYC